MMEEPKQNTLCDLIDAIVINSANGNKFQNISEIVTELSVRLELTYTSTILFSNIFHKSVRGEFPSKSEILPVLEGESTKNVYLSIQELFKKDYIKSFRSHPRRPNICFYTLEELDRKIINDQLPAVKNNMDEGVCFKITITPLPNSNDHLISFRENQIGMIYFQLSENSNFTAVISDKLVAEGNCLEEIEIKINKMLKEKEINLE